MKMCDANQNKYLPCEYTAPRGWGINDTDVCKLYDTTPDSVPQMLRDVLLSESLGQIEEAIGIAFPVELLVEPRYYWSGRINNRGIVVAVDLVLSDNWQAKIAPETEIIRQWVKSLQKTKGTATRNLTALGGNYPAMVFAELR